MKLKGDIDPKLAIDLSNKATLAFLQRHLGKSSDALTVPARRFFKFCCNQWWCWKIFWDFAGLKKNFDQWDPLIDGKDENLIEGTNVVVLQSAIWTPSHAAENTRDWPTVSWMILPGGPVLNYPARPTWHLRSSNRQEKVISTSPAGKILLNRWNTHSVDQRLFHEVWMSCMTSQTLLFTVCENLYLPDFS